MKYCALIAAAGLSSRMRDFKPLMQLGDRTILDHVIENFRRASCDRIAVVIGFRAESLRPSLTGQDLLVCENKEYAHTDMLTSLRIGIAALEEASVRYDCLFLTPGDVPLVLPATLQRMKEQAELGAKIIQPCTGGKAGHPVLLHRSMVQALESYGGGEGLRGFLDAHRRDITAVALEDAGILMDADTRDDYDRLVSMWRARE